MRARLAWRWQEGAKLIKHLLVLHPVSAREVKCRIVDVAREETQVLVPATISTSPPIPAAPSPIIPPDPEPTRDADVPLSQRDDEDIKLADLEPDGRTLAAEICGLCCRPVVTSFIGHHRAPRPFFFEPSALLRQVATPFANDDENVFSSCCRAF